MFWLVLAVLTTTAGTTALLLTKYPWTLEFPNFTVLRNF